MNVWILSVRELTRLLRGRLTWPPPSPSCPPWRG